MSVSSKIEWTDATFNPWIGCTKVSPGCDHCYAEAWDRRFAWSEDAVHWGAGKQRRRTSASNWRLPLRWNAQPFVQCSACGYRCELREFHAMDGPADWVMCPRCSCSDYDGTRRRVFCASLADVFDNEVPPEWRVDLFRLIEATPNLDWLLLTKRIGNAEHMIEQALISMGDPATDVMGSWPWPNVWLGATVVHQEEADRDIPKLLATPAAVRFLSIEPMLGPIELDRWLTIHKHWKSADSLPKAPWHPPYPKHWYERQALVLADWKPSLHWVIAGGESGPKARPMHPDWARSLRDQCSAAGVPFLFKQWGEWLEHGHGQPDRTLELGDEEADSLAAECDGFLGRDGTFIHNMDDADYDQPYRGLQRVGKRAAGRLLDGREWNEFPLEATR